MPRKKQPAPQARRRRQAAAGPARPCPAPAIASVRKRLLSEADDTRRTCGQVLAGLAERTPHFGSALAWLATRDPDAQVRLAAAGLLVAGGQDPSAPPLVARRALEQARPVAREAFSDPWLSEEVKQTCLAILTVAGEEPGDGDLEAQLPDLAGSLARRIAGLAAPLPDAAGSAEELLRSLGLLDDELDGDALPRALLLLREVARTNPPVAATALLTAAAIGLEHARGDDELLAAVLQGAEADPGRALWLLDELLRWPLHRELRAQLRPLQEQLVAAGVTARPLAMPAFSHGWLSQVDGSGSRSLLLAYARGDGARDALLLLFNDQLGLKDAYGVWEEGAAVEEQVRGVGGMLLVPCDLARARALVGDALARHHADERPLPGRFLPLRALLGPEPVPAEPRRVDLRSYLLETWARSPSLVAGSEELAGLAPFEGLGFDSDAAFELTHRAAPRRARSKKERERQVDALLAAVEGPERARLIARLAANLELMAQAGRGKTALARAAAGVYLALEEGLVPWAEVPYVRALAAASLERIRACLAAGYRTQAEANAAALEEEQLQALGGAEAW